MGLKFDMEAVQRAIGSLFSVSLERIQRAGGEAAGEMEESAKQNAPWKDRTGNARRTMQGFCLIGDDGKTVYVGVCGSMPYSPRLELGFGGRYAVLSPTVDAYSPEIVARMQSALDSEGELQ